MDNPIPALEPHLANTLAAFAAAGVEPTPAEIVWLARLRWPCDHPEDGSIPWVMGAPVEYGGVTFWPLHRRAEVWWLRANYLLENTGLRVAAFLFAHAHSALGDRTVDRLMSREQMVTGLRDWFDDIAIPDGQLCALETRLGELSGMSASVPDPSVKASDDAAMSPGGDPLAGFAARMCRAFPGTDPEYWLSGIPACAARDMLDSHDAGPFATSRPRLGALENYRRAVQWVWAAHQPAAPEGQTTPTKAVTA